MLFPQLAGRKGVAASKLRALTSPLRHFGKQNQLRLFPNFTTETTSIAAPTALPFASKRFLFSVKVPLRLRLLSQNNPEKQTGFAPKPCSAFLPLCSTQQGACLFAPALQPDNKTNPAPKPDFVRLPLRSTQQLRCARFSPPNRLRKMAKLLRFPTSPDANFVQRRIFAAVSPERQISFTKPLSFHPAPFALRVCA